MLIQGTSITVTYKKIDGIKRVYYENEGILKDYFNAATVLPIPDEAPLEIPRIIVKTLHEHAQLNISPIAMSFEVHYNDGFEKNWCKCAQYITERMTKVMEFLNILTKNNYEYIGVVTSIILDEVKNDGAKFLSDKLLNAEKIKDIYDINIRYTFVDDDSIFTNIMLQNARIFKKGINAEKPGSLIAKNQTSESVGAIIDINDRFGFNTKPAYKSDSAKLQILLDRMNNIISNKLSILINQGEY